VAYHALYHMHFRLQIDERSFTPWERHRDGAQHLEKFAGKNERSPTACEPYTRDDTLEYLRVCDGMIDTGVDAFDIERGDWNAPSRQMLNKLAQNRVNILVIQRHARSLAARLRRWVGEGVEWLGSA
jgi:hypothetical protein